MILLHGAGVEGCRVAFQHAKTLLYVLGQSITTRPHTHTHTHTHTHSTAVLHLLMSSCASPSHARAPPSPLQRDNHLTPSLPLCSEQVLAQALALNTSFLHPSLVGWYARTAKHNSSRTATLHNLTHRIDPSSSSADALAEGYAAVMAALASVGEYHRAWQVLLRAREVRCSVV